MSTHLAVPSSDGLGLGQFLAQITAARAAGKWRDKAFSGFKKRISQYSLVNKKATADRRVGVLYQVSGELGPLGQFNEVQEKQERVEAADLLNRGFFLDSLFRLTPWMSRCSPQIRQFLEFVLEARGDFHVDEVDERLDGRVFSAALEMAIREKVVATIQEDVDIFWMLHGLAQSSPGKAVGGVAPAPGAWKLTCSTNSKTQEGVGAKKGAKDKALWYAWEVAASRRSSRRLVGKADAWLAHWVPRSKAGLRKKRDLVNKAKSGLKTSQQTHPKSGSQLSAIEISPQGTRSPSQEPETPTSQPGSRAEEDPVGMTFPRTSSRSNLFFPSPPMGRILSGGDMTATLLPRIPPSPMTGDGNPNSSRATDPTAQRKMRLQKAGNRLGQPRSWKRILPMPCKEAPQAPVRWLDGEPNRLLKRGTHMAPWSDVSSTWPPIAPDSRPGSGLFPSVPSSPVGSLNQNMGSFSQTIGSFKRSMGGSFNQSMGGSNSMPELHSRRPTIRTPQTPSILQQAEGRPESPLRAACSPTKQHLHASHSGGALPRLPVHAWDRVSSVAAKVRGLAEGDCVALTAEALLADPVQAAGIEEVDLGGNNQLTEHSLSTLSGALGDPRTSSTLRKLSLRRCVNAGMGTMNNIIKLMTGPSGAPNLHHLDLSGVPIALRCHPLLCAAIRDHVSLSEVRLAGTELGSGIDVKHCVGELLGSSTIKVLDLSWNCFTAEVFGHLGERLAFNPTLRSLSLANCSATQGDAVTPAAFFMQHLSRVEALRRLDLSLNRIDFRAALVLEDAMESNMGLIHLDLSHNPLGAVGLRSAMRLLVNEGCGVERLACDGCSKGTDDGNFSKAANAFSPANPGARYELDLETPQDRALLRMLYKVCHRLKVPPSAVFSESEMKNGHKYRHPEEADSKGIWPVPSKGTITATFDVARALEGSMGKASAFTGTSLDWLTRQQELLRLKADRKKEVLLLAFWRECQGIPDKQLLVLEALSKDFLLTYPQLLAICQDEGERIGNICATLLPCCGESQWMRYFVTNMGNTLQSSVSIFTHAAALLEFNPENTTGHYKLDLKEPCERVVAERLLLLDSWQVNVDLQLGRADSSQRGNHSHVRNERLMNLPVAAASVKEWSLPNYGVFECDYISGFRVDATSTVISPETLSNVLLVLGQAKCPPEDLIKCLRAVADQFYLRSQQLREMMGVFKDDELRAELFVCFCLRLVDIQNWKLVRARIERDQVLNKLQLRLGHVTFFPFMQPEQAMFELDLSYHDQRLCLYLLCHYLIKESKAPGSKNLRDIIYVRADGAVDKLEMGVPKLWESFEKIPQGGIFKGRYVCAPENRNFKWRIQACETYGTWKAAWMTEADVNWWYSLNDVPPDILHLISYIMSWDKPRLPSPSASFIRIAGSKDKTTFTFSLFESTFQHIFSGPQLLNVYRYFDNSGDGRVSAKEWGILDEIWAEIHLSVQEFVNFLERTFEACVERTWAYFDVDSSGDVSEVEWIEAVQRLGYFGPLKTIWYFLDATGRGYLTKDDFFRLQQYGGLAPKSLVSESDDCPGPELQRRGAFAAIGNDLKALGGVERHSSKNGARSSRDGTKALSLGGTRSSRDGSRPLVVASIAVVPQVGQA